MANVNISCKECKTKNKIPKTKSVFCCKKCGYIMINPTEVKERFKLLKKVTGMAERNVNKERDDNLHEIKLGVNNLYHLINEDIKKGKVKDVKRKLYQLFVFDNTFVEKYMLLLMVKLKVTNTVDAYDAFRKLKKKKRNAILGSRYFQILHKTQKYREFLDDMLLHTFFKKIKKQDRIELAIGRGN